MKKPMRMFVRDGKQLWLTMPKAIVDRFQLKPGSKVKIGYFGNNYITLELWRKPDQN